MFYKFEVKFKNPLKNNSSKDELINAVASKSADFNEKTQNRFFYYLHTIKTDSASGGIITNGNENAEDNLKNYLSFIEFDYTEYTLCETTFSVTRDNLNKAERYDYIEDADTVMNNFNILNLFNLRFGNFDYGENIISESNKNVLYKSCGKYLLKQSLTEEFDRIFKQNNTTGIFGHPVHYFIETDDRETRKETTRLLISALYSAKRLLSKHYAFTDIDDCEDEELLSELYESCNGGTVIIRLSEDDIPENNCISAIGYLIKNVCETALKYRNRVLTVICLPRECKTVKAYFLENLGNLSLITIKEEHAYGDVAKDYLKMLADRYGIETDEQLFSKIDDGVGYLAPELKTVFDIWYDSKLKTEVFPQYGNIEINKSQLKEAKPHGTAFDELNGMIGLENAKKVIKQSLDYFKAQKLFKDLGMKSDSVSMHMVFTGNPGTAKTTVARLFAQIMQENNILSKGHLVECGRSDLVGKYVGWTAKIIKEKFKQAKGGVLFIDEAYSLAEDRGGSFGDEAINTIVQEMENHRDELVVIFAGYPHEMETFLNKNPGLRSRIAFHVPFEDYSETELFRIAEYIATEKGVILSDGAKEKLKEVFKTVQGASDFGNGRYVRNVIEKAKMSQASRLVDTDITKLTKKDIITICEEDIEIPSDASLKLSKAKIGFVA